MDTKLTVKDILIGIVGTAVCMGLVFILGELLEKEVILNILFAVFLGVMVYLIAALVATNRRVRQLKREMEEMEK